MVGGAAFAAEFSPLGGTDQTVTTSTQSDLAAPVDHNSGQGAGHCADATAHALEVLLSRQAAGAEVGNSIAAIQTCGIGADGSEGSEAGPPEWVPGPPPWAGAAGSDGAPEGANTGGPPDWIATESPPLGRVDQAATASTRSDLANPLDGNSGRGAAHCSEATVYALEALLSRQAAGGEVGDSIAAIQTCGTGAPEGASTGGSPDWVPGPPPWADSESPE